MHELLALLARLALHLPLLRHIADRGDEARLVVDIHQLRGDQGIHRLALTVEQSYIQIVYAALLLDQREHAESVEPLRENLELRERAALRLFLAVAEDFFPALVKLENPGIRPAADDHRVRT